MTPAIATQRNPWAWIPSLYFVQGIPYVMANVVSVILYKRLGISNTDIALYTSWLYLPWALKPLWSPFVDMFGTKRRWVLAMQILLGALLACVALTIPMPRFFQYTLAFFWLLAFSSATYDIAADGFYMLGLQQHQQAAFVGVRSTFYRIATIASQGLLVILAGAIESHSGLPPVEFQVMVRTQVAATTSAPATPPNPAHDDGPVHIVVESARVEVGLTPPDKAVLQELLQQARSSNIENGFCPAPETSGKKEPSFWTRHVATPLKESLKKHFGDPRKSIDKRAASLATATIRLSGPPQPGQTVAVVVGRTGGDENIEAIEGARLAFTDQNWNRPARVILQVDPKLDKEVTTTFRASAGNIPLAWSTVFAVLAAVFVVFCIYHRFILPYPAADQPSLSTTESSPLREFFRTFALFFQKKRILAAILFLLFFRFAEAQLVKMVSPFLLDGREVGGLGLTTSEVGVAYGTVGIAALTVGGLLGGYVIYRQGLRFWLWPMVLIMHLPDLAFVYLSYAQPENLYLISAAVATEQFGYGFGFTAYMMFMILLAEGEHKTAHYAICTGFMALGMMIPGMYSGWLQETIGYQHFFVWVLLSTIPGFLVAALVKIPSDFGRRKKAA
ncbi:MAG TPA: MFS transporter [Phycisphaerae bacterium]|nr:MFS transporter [Phycisphaerae bacterium]HRY69615.1 MFS transporter [Phycisphaerae bacterium]HSA27270.1 MFS transporter [Phycisphaerae bacterium]